MLAQVPYMPPVWEDVLRQPSNPPLLAYPLALELFFNEVLERSVVSGELRHHGFVVRELLLKLLHLLELGSFQPPIFRTLFLKSGITDATAARYRFQPL